MSPNHRKERRNPVLTDKDIEILKDSIRDSLLEDLVICKEEVYMEINEMKERHKKYEENMEELLNIFRTSKRFIRGWKWIGRFLLWIAATGSAGAAIWYGLKTIFNGN